MHLSIERIFLIGVPQLSEILSFPGNLWWQPAIWKKMFSAIVPGSSLRTAGPATGFDIYKITGLKL